MRDNIAVCQICEGEYKTMYYEIGMTIHCPLCNALTEVICVKLGWSSGYQIKYRAFVQLITNDHSKKIILPIIERWFDCQTTFEEGRVLFKTTDNVYSLAHIHEKIQHTPEWQRYLYNEAMTIWR